MVGWLRKGGVVGVVEWLRKEGRRRQHYHNRTGSADEVDDARALFKWNDERGLWQSVHH